MALDLSNLTIETQIPTPDDPELHEKLSPESRIFLTAVLVQAERLGISSVESFQDLLRSNPSTANIATQPIRNKNEFWQFLNRLSVEDILNCMNLLKSRASPTVSSPPPDIKVQGFKKIEYSVNPFNASDLLRHDILTSFKEFTTNRSKFYSPLLHLFQSSGYGKSRTAVETAQFMDEAFICCRPTSIESGEPTRSLIVVDYIQESVKQTTFSWGLLILVLLIIRKKENREYHMNHIWLYDFVQDKSTQLEFWKKVTNMHKNLTRLYEPTADKLSNTADFNAEEEAVGSLLQTIYWRFTLPETDAFSLNYQTFIAKSCNLNYSHLDNNRDRSFDRPPMFLFVLDEASHVLLPVKDGVQNKAPLLSFRRSLRALSIIFDIFGLTLDTNSKISNYMPETTTDQSGRISIREYQLFEPFIFFPLQVNLIDPINFPVLNFNVSEELGHRKINFPIQFNAGYLLLYSRALFSAHFIDHMNNMIGIDRCFQLIIELARTKLLNINRPEDWNTVTNQPSPALFAALASQLYIMSTVAPMKELLVYQHLATFNGFTTKKHDDIRSAYPSEPIVSEAAMHALKCSVDFTASLQTLKKMVPEILSLNTGGKGEIGELIASIILMRCFTISSIQSWNLDPNQLTRNISRSEILSRPVPFVTFLKVLLNDHPNAADFFNSFMQGGGELFHRSLVQFNHFIKVDQDLTQVDLLYFYKRFAAICCRPGATGIDIVIPIAIPTEINVPINIDQNDTFRMGALAVQVKNTYSSLNVNDLVDQYMKNSLAKTIGFTKGSPEQMFLIMNINRGNLTGVFRKWVMKEGTTGKKKGKKSAVEETQELEDEFPERPFGRLHCKFDETGRMAPINAPSIMTRSAEEVRDRNRFFVLQLCDEYAYPGFLSSEQKQLLFSIRDYNYHNEGLVQSLKRLNINERNIEIIIENRNPGKALSLFSSGAYLKAEGKEGANAEETF